jgi:hypothetical protein
MMRHMIRADFESSQVTVFPGSPVLTPEAVAAEQEAWWGGGRINSVLVPVGFVAMTAGEQRLLGSGAMYNQAYTLLPDDGELAMGMAASGAALREVVEWDKQRGGLCGDITVRTFGGYYRRAPGRHSDDNQRLQARYTWAVGVGATVGIHGEASRDDIVQEGSRRGELRPEAASKFTETQFTPGTVLRHTLSLHDGACGIGTRVLHQATLWHPRAA